MVTSRTRMVKAMMAKPILLNSSTYNTIKVFSMGRMITSSQTLTRRVKSSKGSPTRPGRGRCAGGLAAGLMFANVVAPDSFLVLAFGYGDAADDAVVAADEYRMAFNYGQTAHIAG